MAESCLTTLAASSFAASSVKREPTSFSFTSFSSLPMRALRLDACARRFLSSSICALTLSRASFRSAELTGFSRYSLTPSWMH